MSKVPFEKFIITFLLLNKDIPYIIGKLKEFGYHIEEEEVVDIFNELKDTLPKSVRNDVEDRVFFKFENEAHAKWLEHYGVAEFYDFLRRKDDNLKDPPKYFRWIRLCLWIHNYQEIMSLVNILLFNGDELEGISDVVMFKYKKKIGIEALGMYMRIFWNPTEVSAKEALYHCLPFRKNTLILRRMRHSGHEQIAQLENPEENDGSDVELIFHDANYIKWKIGYRKIAVPDVKHFLDGVKTDSYYKYYEAMNMTQSAEYEEEEGVSGELGAFNKKKTRRRNVEEQKAKQAKHWMDLFVKAEKAMPQGEEGDGDFFDKMDALSLDFDDADEKLISAEEVPDLLDDIRSDKGI